MFELNIQKNWIDALYARSSVRQYTSAPDKAQLDKLGETCRKLSWQGVKIRMFKGPGLKSQIKGTDVYAVIIAKRGTPMEVEGFMGEALVLEATAMGLGTCWLGAGFYPDIINRNVDLQTDEAVPLRYFHWQGQFACICAQTQGAGKGLRYERRAAYSARRMAEGSRAGRASCAQRDQPAAVEDRGG